MHSLARCGVLRVLQGGPNGCGSEEKPVHGQTSGAPEVERGVDGQHVDLSEAARPTSPAVDGGALLALSAFSAAVRCPSKAKEAQFEEAGGEQAACEGSLGKPKLTGLCAASFMFSEGSLRTCRIVAGSKSVFSADRCCTAAAGSLGPSGSGASVHERRCAADSADCVGVAR